MDWVGFLKRSAPLCAATLSFLVAGDAAAAAHRVVFINLDAVTINSDAEQDPTLDSYTSTGFTAGAVSGMALTAEELVLLQFYLKEATAPFDIEYVFERPAAGSYDMVVFGSQADADVRFADSDCPPSGWATAGMAAAGTSRSSFKAACPPRSRPTCGASRTTR